MRSMGNDCLAQGAGFEWIELDLAKSSNDCMGLP